MKRILIFSALLLWAGAGLHAQNLDPTVVVTNTYAREASGIEKPSQLLALPDSVLRFNLDFDYSVHATPYKGAYEFKPYMVELRPTSRITEEGKLYLSAGAGYTLHPDFTFIWSPLHKDHFQMNLYADHHSYWGNYRSIALQNKWFQPDGTRYWGRESHSVAGVNGLLSWKDGQLLADVRYRNVLGTRNQIADAVFHAVDAHVHVQSNPQAAFLYDAETTNTGFWSAFVNEFHSLTKAGVGTHFGIHYLNLSAQAELVSRQEALVGNVAFSPRYLLTPGKFRLDLGAKVSFLFRTVPGFYPQPFVFPLFPDVHITWFLVPNVLTLQASATGGHVMNVYSSMVDDNPFLAGFINLDGTTALALDASVERWNIKLGARGNIRERFYYDLGTGYAFRTNGQLWGFAAAGVPALGYAPAYHLFYVDAALGWKSQSVDVDGHFLYQLTNLNEQRLLAPPAFSMNLRAVYNWGDRIKAGFTLEGQTEQTAIQGSVPGYIDLGLLGDFQMNRLLGIWLRLGNLLNQPVQRVPFHAQEGIYFTLGIRLNL
ncbi:MAG: hypothetical protein J5669_06975 [Bacteroidales bacterium]|nr:hypothetical protein [Bacteroidales bacterium]